jgi:hypothetical protein
MKIFSTAILAALLTSATVDAQQLEMRYDGATLTISGGQFNDRCGVVLGRREIAMELTGGATLQVEPSSIIVLGRLDANGELRVAVGPAAEPGKPMTFFAQALSQDDGGHFKASALKTVSFDGHSFTIDSAVASSERMGRADVAQTSWAWRRQNVA